ncbi:MAG TPA: T9SS type A sorting domain-containing protein, partial [Saprospiraceae bacterium]|nr:T9SS type A sorting domain-containing protein [Saprospiraceae bacterium]
MKKWNHLISLFLLIYTYSLPAQEQLFYKTISMTNVNLRDSAVILARIDAFIPIAGDVVLRFDGVCYSSPGDRIVLAASGGPFWQSNWGNVSVETTNENIGKSFSHTWSLNFYDADAGKVHSFYALGQNWVNQNGSGHAGIYGILTAEFLPYSGTAHNYTSSNTFNGDISNPTVAVTTTGFSQSAGKFLVRFDGWCMTSPGDRVILAASNTGNWLPDAGNVSVEAISGAIDVNAFSHTREYDIASTGSLPFNGIVQRYEETDGNGMAWVYGNLYAEFYPNSGNTKLAFQNIAQPNVDLNDHFVTLSTVTLDPTGPGVVQVDFDGELISDAGDFIELGASNTTDLPLNDGNILLQANDNDVNRNSFAHSRVYQVDAGHYTFYALGKSFSGNPGSGIATIYGELTARYFPDQTTAVHDVVASAGELKVFPNPTTGLITVSTSPGMFGDKTIRLLDETGCLLSTYKSGDAKDLSIDLSSMPDGVYFVASEN